MKKLILLISVFICVFAKAQVNDTAALRNYINLNIVPNSTNAITGAKMNTALNGFLNSMPKLFNSKVDSVWSNGGILYLKKNGNTYSYNISRALDTLAGDLRYPKFDAFLDSILALKVDIAAATPDSSVWAKRNWAAATFVSIPTQSPWSGITLNGSSSNIYLELTNTSSISYTLGWTIGRYGSGTNLAPTANISAVTINGSTVSYTNPSAPGSNSYTTTKIVYPNTSNSYTVNVTTADGKSSSSSIGIYFNPKYYIGTCAGTTPTDAEIRAATQYGWATSKGQSGVSISVTGTKYVFYAYPSSLGTLTRIYNSLGDFTLDSSGWLLTTNSGFNNAQSYNVPLNVYVLQSPQSGNVNGLTFQ